MGRPAPVEREVAGDRQCADYESARTEVRAFLKGVSLQSVRQVEVNRGAAPAEPDKEMALLIVSTELRP